MQDKNIRFDEAFKRIKESSPDKKAPPSRKETIEFSSTLKSSESLDDKEVNLIYNELLSLAERFYNSANTDYKKEDLERLREVIQKMISIFSRKNFETILCLCIKDYGSEEKYLYGHVVNVMILAIFMAKELNYSERDLVDLGICSFLHDLGMLKV
ncbi:MAG: hypothetical protein N2Z79_04895, partial [Candidatus Omnitrophica bacterium]|nr:hypothetical protein [Candidatus Omnitrophota bacterium]